MQTAQVSLQPGERWDVDLGKQIEGAQHTDGSATLESSALGPHAGELHCKQHSHC